MFRTPTNWTSPENQILDLGCRKYYDRLNIGISHFLYSKKKLELLKREYPHELFELKKEYYVSLGKKGVEINRIKSLVELDLETLWF